MAPIDNTRYPITPINFDHYISMLKQFKLKYREVTS